MTTKKQAEEDYNSLPKNKASDKELWKWWKGRLKAWQCDDCRNGRKCKCKKKDAKVYMENERGKRKYFCNIGCIILLLSDKEAKSFIDRQINVEGHYEKMAS